MSHTIQQQILLETAEFLEKYPRKWTRGDFARDKRGRSVAWNSRQAVRFCAMGALFRVGETYGIEPKQMRTYYRRQLAYKNSNTMLGEVNDKQGRKAVIGYLRELVKG